MHTHLNSAQSDFLYNLYLVLREAPLSMHGCYRTFETAAVDMRPWHVEAISLEALRHLVSERKATGLRRGHRMARKERGEQLFAKGVPVMSKDEMLHFFFENDRVTLVTGPENGKDGIAHWSAQIPVPEGRLKGGSYSPRVNRADLTWAEDALRRYEAGQLAAAA